MDVSVAFAEQHERHVAAEQTRSGDNNQFKHGPCIGRRLADDLQDLGRRVLPRQRLGEFTLALGERGQQGFARRSFR